MTYRKGYNMKTYTNATFQGYRQSIKKSPVRRDDSKTFEDIWGISMIRMILILSLATLIPIVLVVTVKGSSAADHPTMFQNTQPKSGIVTKVNDTTLQVKFADGKQKRFFLNDATDVPEVGRKVKVQQALSLDGHDRFNMVGYNGDITTMHFEKNDHTRF